MIPIVSVQAAADLGPDSTTTQSAEPTSAKLAAGSASGGAISQSSSPTAAGSSAQPASDPAIAPAPAAAAAAPTTAAVPLATAVPATATSVPTSAPACQFSQALGEEDGIVRAAQTPPALFYGGGLCAGDKVEALIAGKSCATTTVNATGQWSIAIHAIAQCGPTENAAVTLTVNGKPGTVSPLLWKSGGLPLNIANGYVLTR